MGVGTLRTRRFRSVNLLLQTFFTEEKDLPIFFEDDFVRIIDPKVSSVGLSVDSTNCMVD